MSHTYIPGVVDHDQCWFQDNPDGRGRGITCGLPKSAHDMEIGETRAPMDMSPADRAAAAASMRFN